MPNNSKLGSGLDAIFGSDINSLLDNNKTPITQVKGVFLLATLVCRLGLCRRPQRLSGLP